MLLHVKPQKKHQKTKMHVTVEYALAILCSWLFTSTACGFFPFLISLFDYHYLIAKQAWFLVVQHAIYAIVGFTWGKKRLPKINRLSDSKFAGVVFVWGSLMFGVMHLVISIFLHENNRIFYFPVFVSSLHIGGVFFVDLFFEILPKISKEIKSKTF